MHWYSGLHARKFWSGPNLTPVWRNLAFTVWKPRIHERFKCLNLIPLHYFKLVLYYGMKKQGISFLGLHWDLSVVLMLDSALLLVQCCGRKWPHSGASLLQSTCSPAQPYQGRPSRRFHSFCLAAWSSVRLRSHPLDGKAFEKLDNFKARLLRVSGEMKKKLPLQRSSKWTGITLLFPSLSRASALAWFRQTVISCPFQVTWIFPFGFCSLIKNAGRSGSAAVKLVLCAFLTSKPRWGTREYN